MAGLVGAVAFLTVTLNVPLGATLLAVAWGGDMILPLALLSAGIAHALSVEPGIVPGQLRSRAHSVPVRGPSAQLPDGVRNLPRHVPETPGVPYQGGDGEAGGSERELYRRAVPRSWQGAKLKLVALPPGVEIMGIVRDGEVKVPRPEMYLTPEDDLIFLARPDAYAALEASCGCREPEAL